MRQTSLQRALVLTGTALCGVSDGFIFGQMSGMIDALKDHDSPIHLNNDEISWIAAIINITCFIGFLLLTVITEIFGRRRPVTILTVPVLVSWLMVYFAQDKTMILISRVIMGMSFGGITILNFIIIGEYMSPSIRPICLNLISSVATLAGTMLGHILSIFLHWRNVALVGLIPTALSALLPLFWVESPSWLAMKGRFEECEKAFKALHPSNRASDNELTVLIETRKKKRNQWANDGNSIILLMKKFIGASKQMSFWKIGMLMTLFSAYKVASSRILFSTFAITMLQDITGSKKILLFTLLVDGFTLIGSALSCFVVSKFKMRSLLLILGIIANSFQILFSASLYFGSGNSPYLIWTKVTLLALYFISVNAGPYAVIETLMSEIVTLEIKAIFMFFVGIINGVFQFIDIKIAPHMFLVIGYHGLFFVHALIVFLCFVYFYFAIPETKGRTLQEIEYYFKYNTFDAKDHIRSDRDEVLLNK